MVGIGYGRDRLGSIMEEYGREECGRGKVG